MRDTITRALKTYFDLHELWEISWLEGESYDLEQPKDLDRDVLREALLDVEEAMTDEKLDTAPEYERIMAAAQALLEPKALTVFNRHWEQQAEDTVLLSISDLAIAMLSTLTTVPAAVVFTPTDPLIARLQPLFERSEEVLSKVDQAQTDWLRRCLVGWVDFLPSKVELRALADESHDDFARRCAATLDALAQLYLRAPQVIHLPPLTLVLGKGQFTTGEEQKSP